LKFERKAEVKSKYMHYNQDVNKYNIIGYTCVDLVENNTVFEIMALEKGDSLLIYVN
jgi:hypothetical protein